MASEGALSSPGCRCAWCKGFFRSRLWFGAGVICFLRRNDATVPSVGGMRGLGWAVWLQSISSPGKLLQEDLEAFPSAGRNPSWLMYSASCACPVPCLTVLSLSIWIGRWTAWMLFSSSYLFSLFLYRKSGTGECWWSLLPVCCPPPPPGFEAPGAGAPWDPHSWALRAVQTPRQEHCSGCLQGRSTGCCCLLAPRRMGGGIVPGAHQGPTCPLLSGWSRSLLRVCLSTLGCKT